MFNSFLNLITIFLLSGAFLAYTSNSQADVSDQQYQDLATFQWLHGSKSCKDDQNPAIQVIQADASSYVLRQNKCTTFEAPFIYVLFGEEKALVVDTGAIESPDESPVYQTIEAIVAEQNLQRPNGPNNMLVVHTHSHSDHTKGDPQFKGHDGIEIVSTTASALKTQLGLNNWPDKSSSIDLGGRVITFIPIPGHQEESIAIYDEQTKWLLTGDTLYPGSIRVKNWEAFRNSIERLLLFSQRHPVSLILGAHIEMNAETKKPYKIGKTYQPNEPPLALQADQLQILNDRLQAYPKAKKLKFDWYVISPLSRLEKLIIKTMTRSKPDG